MRILLAFLMLTSPAAACAPDIGQVLTDMEGTFIAIIEAPDGDGYDQVLVMQVGDQLVAARLAHSCPVWPPVALGRAPLRA